MKFVVCVKLTPDTEQLAEVQPQDVGSADLGVTMVLNPWDEFAVEEALRLSENFGGSGMAVTVGGVEATEALKRAVAMGIEEAILLTDPAFEGSDPWGVAHILAQAVRKIGDAALILTGRQSVDGGSGLVAAGLAAELGIPFVSQVARIVDVTDESATVLRPLAVSKEINEPRYPNFMGIRKAARMQYPTIAAAQLPGLAREKIGAGAALTAWSDLRKPPVRAGKCEFIGGATVQEQAQALVEKLIAEKVI